MPGQQQEGAEIAVRSSRIDHVRLFDSFARVPDQTCPEEQLTAQTIVHGYRETTDALGISDASESTLTLVNASGIQPPSRVLQVRGCRARGTATAAPRLQ